jgi:hypothetical protein
MSKTAIWFYHEEIQSKLDKAIHELKIPAKHREIVDDILASLIPDFAARQIRCTIYIPDALFAESLYQLTDYYPVQATGGRGRTFSSRYGIIGKAWRLRESQHASSVPTDERDLILGWGMNREEAQRAGHGKQSFGCIVLKGTRSPLGMLYFDSPLPNAFGDDKQWEQLKTAVLQAAAQNELVAALQSIHLDILRLSPQVRIYSTAEDGIIE